MDKFGRILRLAFRLPLLMLLGDIWGAENDFDPDAFVKRMNPHMPLTGEVLFLGIKSDSKWGNGVVETKILESLGRNLPQVRQLGKTAEYHKLIHRAERVADSPPYDPILVAGVFRSTGVKIPNSLHTILLSMDSEGGVELVESIPGQFCISEIDGMLEPMARYPGYDRYLMVYVLGHEWPD